MAVDSSAKHTGPTLVSTGQYAGQPGIALRRPVYVIGSRADARIHLKSSTVSRAHAIMVQTRHETYIRDLASRGGIFVNGKQVREAVLTNGDLIGIGKFTFQYQANHISHGAEPSPHPAALQVSGGEFPIPVEGRVVLIGRRSGCDIQLTEEAASSSHAVILQWEGLRFIRDLGSRTGTFVNGQKIHEVQLNPNDAIRIGETDITYSPSLEEAAFDLISDASDSMIATHPVAEEVNVLPRTEPAGTAAAPIVPHLAIAEIHLDPIAHEGLPLEEVAADVEPVAELPPLPLEAEASAEAPVEVAAAKPSSEPIPMADEIVDLGDSKSDHDADLVALAADDAEPLPMEFAPHDTAHIPLAVNQTEAPVETSIEAETPVADSPQHAVVDGWLQPPVGSVEMAGEVEPVSETQTVPTENFSEAIPLAETPHAETPTVETVADAELPTAVADHSAMVESAMVESAAVESGAVESDGLELLDESGIPPFTPVSPEPLAADLLDAADLPRRGWRSGIVEPAPMVEPNPPAEIKNEIAEPTEIAPPVVPSVTSMEQEAQIKPRIDEQLVEPEIGEAKISAPEFVESQLDDSHVAEDEIAEPDVVQRDVAEPNFSQTNFGDTNIAEINIPEPELTADESALLGDVQSEISEPKAIESEPSVPEIGERQATDDVLQFADETTLTEEPIAEHDAVIDLSALLPADDFTEPVDLAVAEPVEEPVADLDIAVELTQPATAQPFDLSSIDFTGPGKTIADLANEAPVLQSPEPEAATETETPTNVAAEISAEVPAAESATESAPQPVVEEPPLAENIPDEFVPSGEVSPDDFPADDGESLSSFQSRRKEVRGKAARARRPRTEKIQPIVNETIEPTEPTPQSALDLPSLDLTGMEPALAEIPGAAMAAAEMPAMALPLVDLVADLSDTSFGKAVQEFEGESTGPIVEAPIVESPLPDESNAEAAEQEPIAFAEVEPAAVAAPNFHGENMDAPETLTDADLTDAESADIPAAHVPLFDANTIEDSIPSDLGAAPHPTVQRPLELPKSDFVGVDNTYVVPEDAAAPPPRVSNSLDLSKLEMEAEPAPALEESVVSDVLSDAPMKGGHATTDSSIDLSPQEVTRSDEGSQTATTEDAHDAVPQSEAPHAVMPQAEMPQAEMPHVEVPDAEMPSEPQLAELHPADVEIDGADIDGLGANQTHYLGGEPLNLKEGVHPPEGFGDVSVDFSQPPVVHADAPGVMNEEVAPPPSSQTPSSPLPVDHDILPPEAGDAVIPAAPAVLSSLTALAAEVAAVGVAADPFLIDRAMSKVEIPAFGLAGTSTAAPAPTVQPEPPAVSNDPDAPLRSIGKGKGKGRRSRVIRNGFGQNPDAPKSEPTEASPFADSAAGLSGMAMDNIAAPAMPDVDVFSDLPPRGENGVKADVDEKPLHVQNEAGRDLTADAWTKTSPLPGRSRRRSSSIPFVPPVAMVDSAAAAAGLTAGGITAGGLTGMGPEYQQPRPAILLEDENRANAAAERRSKLLKRVPILCATMVALIGVAVTICVLFIPVRQQVQATMSYRNFDSLTHEEQLHFQADQLRKLHSDSTRMSAITKLQNRHPNATPGFLNSPEQFSTLQLEWPESRAGEPGISWINYQSSDTNVDPARVQAVAQAMFDVNSDLATAAQSVKQSMDKLHSDIASETLQNDEDTNKINQERAFLDGRPTLSEIGKLKDDDATLETAYKDALAKATDAQAAVDQLKKENAAENKPVAPGVDPVAADAQIQQMSKDAGVLNDRIAAARKERADLAAKARATLDSAYDEFKKQVQDSATVTKDNPQLAAYVTAAQNLQQAIHQLTDEYIQKQQDEYTQLNQMKSSLVAKIQQRQADLFANDPQMKQLNDQKEILTRQYNEAVNSGLDQDASDLKNKLQLNDTATKAQKELITNDPVYAELLNDMQTLLDQKQSSIDQQKKNTDQQLASMKEQFEKSAPTVQQLPAEQKQLAAAMQDKLAQIDAARKQYAEAADASVADSDSSIKQMVNDLQTLQTNIETRKRQVAETNSAAARKARDDQFNADLSQKTTVLDQLNKTTATAQAAYLSNHAKLLQREAVADQTNASAQRLEQDINDQQALQKQIEQHKMAWDQKNSEFGAAIEPLEPEAQAHLVGSPIDNRVMYAGISSGAIVLVFLIAICWTVIAAARESQHAYVPAFESLETRGEHKKNGEGNGMQREDAEEERAAVA